LVLGRESVIFNKKQIIPLLRFDKIGIKNILYLPPPCVFIWKQSLLLTKLIIGNRFQKRMFGGNGDPIILNQTCYTSLDLIHFLFVFRSSVCTSEVAVYMDVLGSHLEEKVKTNLGFVFLCFYLRTNAFQN